MYCIKCGAKLEEGASFCPQCGEPVQNQTAPAATASAPVAAAKNKSKKVGLIVGISIAVAVVVLAVLSIAVILIGGRIISSVTASQEEQSPASYSEETESSYSDAMEGYMYYLQWQKDDWEAASYEDQCNAVFASMCYILLLNDIELSDAVIEQMAIQQYDWVDSVSSYYALDLGDKNVFEIMCDSTLVNNLLIAAGVDIQ